ncbi:MAG: hypothetical protein HY779_02440, partial [Rubrobacteridae bacterium]|nr:hypothetical protein [Rubrobacteridae bacterium]
AIISYSVVKKLKDKVEAGDRYEFKLEFCVGCRKCAEECPCNYIDMI